jgi:thiaminase/transcriptional activator TenA
VLYVRTAGLSLVYGVDAGKENTYFERSFEKLGVSEAERCNTPDASCTTSFCRLMRETANSGSLGEMLAVMVVCEWSYLSWGSRVETVTNRDDFVTYEWVDLHSGKDFADVVEYLRELLDKEGDLLLDDEKSREACKSKFLEAVQYEEDFFDFAYIED